MPEFKKIVIGLDQSYTRTGVSVVADGKLMKVTSINFRGCTIKSEKRKVLRGILSKLIKNLQPRTSQLTIICERVRTFSHSSPTEEDKPDAKGKGKNPGMFISTSYIKATGALIATIVDTAYDYGIDVFSADTRAWKSKVIGSSKSKDKTKKGHKGPTIQFILKRYPQFTDSIVSINKKGNEVFDDDAADSACIALYGFVKEQKLNKEE